MPVTRAAIRLVFLFKDAPSELVCTCGAAGAKLYIMYHALTDGYEIPLVVDSPLVFLGKICGRRIRALRERI